MDTFDGKREEIWTNAWRYTVDKATAEEMQQYCQDRVTRGQPIYRELIERDFELHSTN
jgi:hypothetical protein